MKNTIILGASGQIGSAYARYLGRDYQSISWEELQSSSEKDILERTLTARGDYDFILAGGVTDPKLPKETILESNLLLIQRVVRAARDLEPSGKKYRFITLGTIHETFSELSKTNPYLESKVALGNWMEEQARQHGPRYMHLRLQTIYGSEPRAHMFLGQIFQALKANQKFKMSSGEQLREYHHADEIAQAMKNLSAREWDFGASLDICSGEAIRLADLAREIFRAFDSTHLLEIGALPTRREENRERTFERSPEWLVPQFRDAIPGIIECLAENLGRKAHIPHRSP